MGLKNTLNSYGSITKFFHWLIFILIFFMIIFGFLLEFVPKDYQPITYNIHKLTGLTILTLMLLRALWSSINAKPLLPFYTPAWQKIAEHVVHYSLYVVIIAMPIAGWIGSCAAGKPPHLGSFTLNLPVPQDKALVEAAFNVHMTLAFAIIVLVTIHVSAALYHHYIKKDNILRRMLPGSNVTA